MYCAAISRPVFSGKSRSVSSSANSTCMVLRYHGAKCTSVNSETGNLLHISRKLTHSEHYSGIGSKIGLSSVPESQVTYDDASFLDDWLRGWPNLPTSVKQMFLDSSASAVTVFAFLIGNGGIIVRTEPNFSRTILRSHGD